MPGQDNDEPEIRPTEMFEVVVAAMKAAPHDSPHEAWVATVAELYSIAHETATIAADLVPAGKQHLPSLRSDEKAYVFKFFVRACIASDGSFVQ